MTKRYRAGTCHVFGLAICLALSACLHQQNSDSTLLGSWQTALCKKPDQQWLRGIYTFKSNGDLLFAQQPYADADCITPAGSASTANIIGHYDDRGFGELPSGLDGNRLYLESGAESSTGFYTLETGEVCFSFAFTFGTGGLTIISMLGEEISFIDCLQPLP